MSIDDGIVSLTCRFGNSPMSRRIRLILTAAFVAGFILVAPLVLLYTAGYRYDWHKQRIQKTGIIQTDSIPDNARITLNGATTGRTTPYQFAHLLPEEYRVRFEKDGYFPWEKTVEVKSGATAFVTETALIRDAAPTWAVEGATAQAAFTADSRRVAYFVDGAEWRELTMMDLGAARTAGSTPVTLARFTKEAFSDARLRWSPSGERLLLVADNADRGTTIVVYDGADTALSLHEGFPAVRLSASWSDDGATIAIVSPGGVFLADAASGDAAPALLAPDVVDAALSGRTLFVLRETEDAVALERRGTAVDATARTLVELPRGAYRFVDASGPALLIADEGRGRLLAFSPDDGTLVENLPATDARWFRNGRDGRLLAWNAFEITVANLENKTRRLVTRLGARIDRCAWHPSGLAIFYSAGGGLQAVDLDGREPKNVHDLAPDAAIADFAVDPTEAMLRFAGTIGGRSGIYEREY